MQVIDMVQNENYLHRMSVLYCLRSLCDAVTREDANTRVVPIFVQAAGDPVPNIRFVSAKILQQLKPLLAPELVQSSIVPCLTKLSHDDDPDVRYYAEQALQELQAANGAQ